MGLFKKVAGPILDPILFPLESRREKYGDFPPVLRGRNYNMMGENWGLPREKWISFLDLLLSRRGGKQGLLSDLQGQNKKKKKALCSTPKCTAQGLKFLDFLGFSQDAQMCLFGAVRG